MLIRRKGGDTCCSEGREVICSDGTEAICVDQMVREVIGVDQTREGR